MKKILYFAAVMLLLIGCQDNSGLSGLLTDYDSRIAELEKVCTEMNTNITSMQTIINAYESGDVITNISPLVQNGEEVGYIITFSNHESIILYHGKNGNDGATGAKGEDGITPNIGVKQDTDGIYYWTLNGEWLLGDNGEKLPVSGKDGADGSKGDTGAQGDKGDKGDAGKDGKDGITPQLKIEDGYWFVSTDNGQTWTNLGKATGEDGAKGDKGDKGDTGATGSQGEKGDTGVKGDKGDTGEKGDKGDTGDSFFQSVTQDDDYVYFTLTDGTVIKIAKGGNGSNSGSGNVKIVDGAIQAAFSVSDTKKVYFSQGNLQYQASTNTWRFAEHQFDYIGVSNDQISSTYSGWIDLFAYGTSGYDGKFPYMTSTRESDYIGIDISDTQYDLGYNRISNGGNLGNMWRTLTADEWMYLCNTNRYRTSIAIVNNEKGLIILPDVWMKPSGIIFTANQSTYAGNTYSLEEWLQLEAAGAIFLPAAGYRSGTFIGLYDEGYYMTSTYGRNDQFCLFFREDKYYWHPGFSESVSTFCGMSVRLVQDVEE